MHAGGRLAIEVVDQLERGDASLVWDRLPDRLKASTPLDRLREWPSSLDNWVGSPRRIIDAAGGSHERVLLQGDQGTASVVVRFDDENRVVAIEVAPWVNDGVRNVVIGCPLVEESARALADFYSALFGMHLVREDWIKLGWDRNTYPQLAFGDGWSDE